MGNKKVNISIIGAPSMHVRHFMIQFTKLLAKSIAIVDNLQKNGVLLELCNGYLPDSMVADRELGYVACDDFLIVNGSFSQEFLTKIGMKRNLDYIVSDVIKEGTDLVFFVVEQSLDSADFIDRIFKQFYDSGRERSGTEKQRLGIAEQRLVFLNFQDNRFPPEYFTEFRLSFDSKEMKKYYIDFDENDVELGLHSDVDADFSLIKLSNHRLYEIVSMFEEMIRIDHLKNHVKQLKQNEKISRRRRKC